MAKALPTGLVAYLAQRDALRAERIGRMWTDLTERERDLVKDAAVMGFVQGNMAERGKIPGDGDIVRIILGACDALPDLYPTISALAEASR